MGERGVLPIQAILNHSPPRPRLETPSSHPSGSELSSPASDICDVVTPRIDGPPAPKIKRSRDSSDLTYTKPQGLIKYPPFESLNDAALRLMDPFNVYPFGEIGQYCAHIPYSSDKKDVFEKTGRESFHVFVYRFTDPNDGLAYDVMWDYLGGFVRISPFFKCRKHKKTGPAKMLDANAGLRDITFHMTGGNRVAQGYWVPYNCARAVCATFCYPIAGALIPIFGPSFPEDCIKPDSTKFGRMDIDEEIIRTAKIEVTASRHASINICQKPNSVTSYPRPIEDRPFDVRRRYQPPPLFEPYHPHPPPWNSPKDPHPHPHSHPRQSTRSAFWGTTPEREALPVTPNGSPNWTPINARAVREEPLSNIDPFLTAMPHAEPPKNPDHRNQWYSGYRTESRETYKRGRSEIEEFYKRRKLHNDRLFLPESTPPTSYISEARVPLPDTTGPVGVAVDQSFMNRALPAISPQTPVSHLVEKPQHDKGDYEAAFALMLMNQQPRADSSPKMPSIKRARAKSL